MIMLLSHPTAANIQNQQQHSSPPSYQIQPSARSDSQGGSGYLNQTTTTAAPNSSQHLHHPGPLYVAGHQQAALSRFEPSALAVPRAPQATIENVDLCLNQPPELMPSEPWAMASQYTPKSVGRVPHQRESSLSSLGSAGPASPFNHNTSNPQIALSDPANDSFSDLQAHDASYYQLAKAMPVADNMYPGYHNVSSLDHPEMGYPSAIALQQPRSEKEGLLPTPDFGAIHGRSHPHSVASSTVGGDSPATPSLGEPIDGDKRKTGFAEPPKLDRTMTDIYSDELYNPSFTITSASPSQSRLIMSPNNDIFAQRLNAANSQHLSAGHSPTSSVSRDISPFCSGSPHAASRDSSNNNNSNTRAFPPSSHMGFNSAHHMREQEKAKHDAQILQQQVATKNEPETPKTISPKDAMLEFNGADVDSNFPSLFPSQDSADFGVDPIPKTTPSHDQIDLFQRPASHSTTNPSGLPYMASQLPGAVQVPQQYPFVAHPGRQPTQYQVTSAQPSPTDSSVNSSGNTPAGLQKPKGTGSDSGTYTCTYHGCTLRFETPALLQKHKREGHRQPQGLGTLGTTTPRATESASPGTDSLLNSQAGPHRCDRINPSTGKPCNTIFSRPYDLTRHEDTIHNARKQKVQCNLCTEEKTFSRADALTRHYRVCHPDVEFPGKYRRRGQVG